MWRHAYDGSLRPEPMATSFMVTVKASADVSQGAVADGIAEELSTKEVVDLAEQANQDSGKLVEETMAEKVRAGESADLIILPCTFTGPQFCLLAQ